MKSVKIINELIVLQFLSLIILFYFFISINILLLWYLSGLYLLFLGTTLLLNDGDIFTGFLWVIDLGVGLILFIFILHFSNFLYQKSSFSITKKSTTFFFFFCIFIFLFSNIVLIQNSENANIFLQKTWFFFISWYDYYDFFNLQVISDLNLLREIYFYNNSLEFFILNFSIFYGIFAAICLSFFIKRIFSFIASSQLLNYRLLSEVNSYFFIRNQNFIKQQNTSAGTRVWTKKKNINI